MKNAILLTGAAARISQEVALIDKLIELKGLELKPDNTMLAGFSSGAINIAAINACFNNKSPLSWNNYFKNEVLFRVKTINVFTRNKFIPVNTTPLRELLTDFLSKAQIRQLDDCPFDSYILAFSVWRLSTIWASNKYNRHNGINMVDLLMASSAIPIIFPDQNIGSYTKRTKRFLRDSFFDGGTGGSFKRFERHLRMYVKQNGSFEKLYIISPMREVSSEDYEELNKLIPTSDIFRFNFKDLKILKLFLDMISQNGFDTFIKRFHKWILKNKIADEYFVCIPSIDENYPLLNFDKQKKQYDAVCKWVDENPSKLAIPINEYVQKIEDSPMVAMQLSIQRGIKHRFRSIFH
jgi:hypothetical protein